MKQKDKRILITSTTLCVVLFVLSAALDKMNGGGTGTYMVLYGLAVLLNIVINLGLSSELVSINGAKSLVSLGKWIMPITEAAFFIPQIYLLLFPTQNITEVFVPVFVGILLIISGNYFPKNHINSHVGLKFPWLFNDEEGWYRTHKLGSYTWILAGIILIIHPTRPGIYNRSAGSYLGYRCSAHLLTCPLQQKEKNKLGGLTYD